VDAILVLGGNGWQLLRANAGLWSALYDALRSDLAQVLECYVGNVTITECTASGNGLTVNYRVNAATDAEANAITTKAKGLVTSELHATTLLYVSAVPSGSNVTLGWSSASVDNTGTSAAAAAENLVCWLVFCLVMVLPATIQFVEVSNGLITSLFGV